jgi:hypothetical protein
MQDLMPEFEGEETVLNWPGISLHDFMQQTTVYEQMPVPFSPQLRRSAFIGMLFTLIAMLGSAVLPPLCRESNILNLPFLGSFNAILYGYVGWMSAQVWLSYFNGALLVSGLLLLMLSRNLHVGPPWQHWGAFAHAVIGVINILLVLFPLALLLAKLLIWVVMGLLAVIIVGGILRALFVHQ